MKILREYKSITVTKKAEIAILSGHPWVYFDEITNDTDVENGSIVDVLSEKGSYLGSGIYSQNSKIRVRILSRNINDTFDEFFFKRRIKYAIDYRKTVMRDDLSNCRLIFGEADGLPGLTVDKFSNIIVVQILSYGIEIRKNLIFNSLLEILTEYGETIDGIYERNDVAIRKLEGLEENKKWYFRSNEWDEDNNITYITENGIKYEVDFFNGQKTGFFLDQKFNRAAVAKLSKGKKVLDCFTHTGSFALNAAYGGAEKVTAVDISQHAIDTAKRNAARNNLDSKIEFIVDDVFDLLTDKIKKNEYDFIILDPPAFTKSRKTILNAKRGYGEINYRAMKLLPRGGYLATCSCSHFMEDKLFVKMLKESAANAQVQLKQIEAKQQSPDHPILWNVPETDYLKFYIFQII